MKSGLARWLPAIPNIVKDDPWWTDPKDPHRLAYVNRAYWARRYPATTRTTPACPRPTLHKSGGTAHASVIRDNMSPETAADTALKHIEAILAKYPIAQT